MLRGVVNIAVVCMQLILYSTQYLRKLFIYLFLSSLMMYDRLIYQLISIKFYII
jgi:hypothetical protein